MNTKKKSQEEADLSQIIGGTLNIFGMNLDLSKLLSSTEDANGQLEKLRERLKGLGGKEALSDEDWKQGATSVSGHVKVRGIGGEQEYHIGTSAGRRPRAKPQKEAEPQEVSEPSLDIFQEPEGVTIVADVPGISQEDLDIHIEGQELSISTRPSARRAYKKTVPLDTEVDPQSLQASCRNGVLEIRLKKAE
ncbi:MAG: Hsp20/alpha crystallin family protein [Dehalococcoidia bacterium]|nr:Hsp20/alpha crystallin family protein [Dehalococcoidia bacterium]